MAIKLIFPCSLQENEKMKNGVIGRRPICARKKRIIVLREELLTHDVTFKKYLKLESITKAKEKGRPIAGKAD